MAIKTLITEDMIEKYKKAGFWGYETILEYLKKNSEIYPDKNAFVDDNLTVSFKELWDNTSRLAQAFSEFGIEKEDIVAVQLPNCVEFVYTYYALSLIGAIMLPVHMPYRKKDLLDVIDRFDCKYLIGPDNDRGFDYYSMYADIHEARKKAIEIIIVGDTGAKGFPSFDDLIQKSDIGYGGSKEQWLAAANDVNAIFLTSGTTGGKIKGVMWTINMFTHNAKAFNESYMMSHGDRSLFIGPFTHISFVLTLNAITYLGSTLVTIRDMNVKKAITMIEKEGITALMGVPTQYSRMLDEPSYKEHDTSSLRTLVSFGSAVPAELVKRVRDEMCQFNLWYGTTEAGYCTTKWGLPLKTLQETVGNPQRGAEWKVIDLEGNTLPKGIEGELCINGPVRSAGYFNDDERNKESFDAQGWFHSGDLGYIDYDSNVHVTGRIKDLIIRGGENILPNEIENEIYEHPNVQDVAVVGIPDPDLGERVCAYVKCMENTSLSLEEVREFLQKKELAYFKLPERLEVIENFPRTDSGKIQKFELKKDLEKKLQEKGSADPV